MTEAQSILALSLLREALEWVGMVELSDEEEGKAEEVGVRIERLLVDCGAMPAPPPPIQCHDRLIIRERYLAGLRCRLQLRLAEEERSHARGKLDRLLRQGGDVDAGALRYATKRYQVACTEFEAAENEVIQAEAEYYRALSGGSEGQMKCAG